MVNSLPRSPFFLVLMSLAVAACSSESYSDGASAEPAQAAGADQAQSAEGATLEAATALGVRNARMPLPGLITAGQLTEEQLAGLVEAGYAHFISLRLPDEDGAGWEEAHAMTSGLDFTRLPVAGAGGLNRENVEALAALLESTGGEPTVLYCGSSNRVGAMLALKAVWVDGAEPEAALELGVAGGMTRLADPVRDLLGLGN